MFTFLLEKEAQVLLNEEMEKGNILTFEIKDSTMNVHLKDGRRVEASADDAGEMFIYIYGREDNKQEIDS